MIKKAFGFATVTTLVFLSACSSKPSSDDISSAVKKSLITQVDQLNAVWATNQQQVSSDAVKTKTMFDKDVVKKGSCIKDTNSPGYICNFDVTGPTVGGNVAHLTGTFTKDASGNWIASNIKAIN